MGSEPGRPAMALPARSPDVRARSMTPYPTGALAARRVLSPSSLVLRLGTRPLPADRTLPAPLQRRSGRGRRKVAGPGWCATPTEVLSGRAGRRSPLCPLTERRPGSSHSPTTRPTARRAASARWSALNARPASGLARCCAAPSGDAQVVGGALGTTGRSGMPEAEGDPARDEGVRASPTATAAAEAAG
jgi:hypothetical protein